MSLVSTDSAGIFSKRVTSTLRGRKVSHLATAEEEGGAYGTGAGGGGGQTGAPVKT